MNRNVLSRRVAFVVAVWALFITGTPAAEGDWIAQSNQYAQLLLDVNARYQPEAAADLGLEKYDSEIFDLKPQYAQRQEADLAAVIEKLEAARGSAADERVKQDIDILIKSAQQERDTSALNRRLMIPYFDLGRTIFSSFQDLLDPRVAKSRQTAALVRLRRYAGAEKGYEPIVKLAQERIEERMSDGSLTWPWIVEVEQDRKNGQRYIDGTRDLLRKSGLKGWQKNFNLLTRQLQEHDRWVRETVLPRARKTNRLPPAIYADNLKVFGVEADPRELMQRALFVYMQTRDELQTLARLLATERHWKSADYRDVIRELKKQQVPEDKVLELYKSRLAQIEDIVRQEHIVTLPSRPAVIRLAGEAESAAQPAPHLDPPRLIGNTGESAEFVLPTKNPNATPGVAMDDFSYDGITWTLTAHEARPGHELQFAAMLEHGVSTTRAVFAFNSANVEGWALYAEAVMKQYLPLEGQIGSLQMRLMRAARAFLDPMLNLGLIEPDAAKRVLMDEVVLSEPMAKQEVDRYTFNAPGQATSYFYGYTHLEALRAKVELALGDKFDTQAYHDFIVSEGLLPLDLLEEAVMTRFVPAHERGSSVTDALRLGRAVRERRDLPTVCGKPFSGLPADWSRLRIPEHEYAVFTHDDHISTIRSACNTIWSKWLPESERAAADAPDFERYGESFDPLTGRGDIEIWVPVESGVGCG